MRNSHKIGLSLFSISGCLLLFTIVFIFNDAILGRMSNVAHMVGDVSRNPLHVFSKASPSNNQIFLPPDNDTMATMTKQQLLEIYWRYINTMQVLCRNQTRIGSMKDGGKEICVDEKYKPRAPCLVYSFGSNYQFDFEKDVIDRYGCEVHTFDPSTPVKVGKSPPIGCEFHLIGISDRKMVTSNGWNLDTLSSLRKQLNHTDRVLDILKVDVEGGEWSAMPQMFQSGVLKYVKQLSIEIHFGERANNKGLWGNVTMAYTLSVLRQLYDYGFHIFMREHNLYSIQPATLHMKTLTTVNEISLINVNFKDDKSR